MQTKPRHSWPKNSFSTCALRWKWRLLVSVQQTARGGRQEGKLQLFVRASQEIVRESVFSRGERSIAACDFSGIGVTAFRRQKRD